MFNLFKSDKNKYLEYICARSKYGGWVVGKLATGIIPDVPDAELKRQLLISKDLIDAYKKLPPLPDLRHILVVFEFLFIHLHLLDRVAFQQHMVSSARDKFMREIENKAINTMVNEIFHHFSSSALEEMRNDINEQFRNSMLYYSQFKAIFPEDNESPNGTLMWEFGKNVAEIAERELGASIITTSYSMIMTDITKFDIVKFVQSQI
jgi:hypothetical protein